MSYDFPPGFADLFNQKDEVKGFVTVSLHFTSTDIVHLCSAPYDWTDTTPDPDITYTHIGGLLDISLPSPTEINTRSKLTLALADDDGIYRARLNNNAANIKIIMGLVLVGDQTADPVPHIRLQIYEGISVDGITTPTENGYISQIDFAGGIYDLNRANPVTTAPRDKATTNDNGFDWVGKREGAVRLLWGRAGTNSAGSAFGNLATTERRDS